MTILSGTAVPIKIIAPKNAPVLMPFSIFVGQPIVPLKLVDGTMRSFSLDTGSPVTTLLPGTITAESSDAGDTDMEIHGGDFSGAGIRAKVYHGCSLSLGGVEFKSFDVLVDSEHPKQLPPFMPPDGGTLGWPLFSHLLLTIDYDKKQIEIQEGKLPPANMDDVLPIRISDTHAIEVQVTLDGRELWLNLDTGAAYGENAVVSHAVAEHLKWRFPPVRKKIPMVDGEVEGKSGVMRGDLRIGRYQVHEPTILETTRNANLLAVATLRHFRLTLDLDNLRIRLTGPSDVRDVRNSIPGEAGWNASTELTPNARSLRHVKLDPSAVQKGVTLEVKDGVQILSRPGNAKLIVLPSGVLMDAAGDFELRFTVKDQLVLKPRDCAIDRWYECSGPSGTPPAIVLLNPFALTQAYYINPANGEATTIKHGLMVVARPDRSTHTVLQDGVELDRTADGDVNVSWPKRPSATR